MDLNDIQSMKDRLKNLEGLIIELKTKREAKVEMIKALKSELKLDENITLESVREKLSKAEGKIKELNQKVADEIKTCVKIMNGDQ